MNKFDDKMQQILEIGIALTAQKDSNKLLDLIISTAMELTNSDGGTLYLIKDNALSFKIMKTVSLNINRGANGESIDLPPVEFKEENICAYCAISKQSLNIEDVYKSEVFDFSGPKRYDMMNGYHTQSMVAIPMIGKDEDVIGVMQLINAMDDMNNIRQFTKAEEKILMALASQTAILLSNMAYMKEITRQMWSFTEAMTEAIDARTPYNASHTRKVAQYSGMIVDYINKLYSEGKEELYFSKEHKDQIVLAAFLHDIGKIVTPIEVMNKQTRLDHYLERIESRLDKISLIVQVDELKKLIDVNQANIIQKRIEDTRKIISEANSAGFLQDELLDSIDKISAYEYTSLSNNQTYKFLTEDEKDCLMIRKGTLTAAERKIMENHVVMTERILSKVHFNKAFAMAPVWAAQHHECINSKGYPKKIGGDELGVEARILAVADICDALLATDRPYKKPLPKEKAFAIMKDMAANGAIDEKLVGYMEACLD